MSALRPNLNVIMPTPFFHHQFGGKITQAHLKRYERSPNWKKGCFRNRSVTKMMHLDIKDVPGFIAQQFTDIEIREPQQPIEIKGFSGADFDSIIDKPRFTWFGHSVALLKINGKNLLIDPMFGPDTSPIGPMRTKRFSENTLDLIDALPPIDAILFTHDHYDHLDYASMQKLKGKTDRYFTALGVGRHLERWGISTQHITEFDWWDTLDFEGVKLTFTPSRHFSGRGLTDRSKCLWGGWVFQTTSHQIYWSGDGGYDTHFKEVGERFGAFDWMFAECGQYNEKWYQTHMNPEESIQAVLDAQAKIAIPYHWGGFALALHPWKDPVERFVAEAKRLDQTICTPKIGAIVTLGAEDLTGRWYEELE